MRFGVAPWTAGLVGAGLAVALSVFYLVFVLVDVSGGDPLNVNGPPPLTGDDSAEATPEPTEPVDVGEVLFEGDAPDALVLDGMRAAAAGETADLRFARAMGDEGIAIGYYVPVVAQWTAIDALSSDDLVAVLSGDAANWAEVDGLDVPVRYFAVEDSAGHAIAQALHPGATPDETFATYEELIDAVSPESGAIAFIPLDRLNVTVSAVGIDGVDIARGYGDVGSWPFIERVEVEALTDRGEAVLPGIEDGQLEPPVVASVVATGDFLPVRCSLARIEATGDWASPFRGEMGEYMRSADLTLSSLDAGIHDLYDHYRCVSEPTILSAPSASLEALTYAGVDAVTIATNHIFDCGTGGWWCEETFIATMENLDDAGIAYVGGGMNLEEALSAEVFERNGMTFGVLGFDDIAAEYLEAGENRPGTAPMDDDYSEEREWGQGAFWAPAEWLGVERLQSLIAELKEEVDFVVVLVQTGTEDYSGTAAAHDPSERSIKALRAAVDAGADLVVGNQAHLVQAAEVRDESYIGYALGNFVYDQVHTSQFMQCYLLEGSFWPDRLAAVRLVPCEIQEQYRPVFVDRATELTILGDVYGASQRLLAQD